MALRITTMYALAALLAPTISTGQQTDIERPPYPPGVPRGMVLDEGEGRWRPPTAAEILREIAAPDTLSGRPGPFGRVDSGDLASRLLRQEYGPVSTVELAELANGLADLILAEESRLILSIDDSPADDAQAALMVSAWPDGVYIFGYGYATDDDLRGKASQAAFDALVRVYETFAARTLVGIDGDDPFTASTSPDGIRTDAEAKLHSALRSIYWSDPVGKGRDYVVGLFERSELPPPLGECSTTYPVGEEAPRTCPVIVRAWCVAGELLHKDWADTFPPPVPGPDPQEYFRRCPAKGLVH